MSEDETLDYVVGVTTILDQTAEDILQRNPGFLTRSKNLPGFFSSGPQIVPMAECRIPRIGTLVNPVVAG